MYRNRVATNSVTKGGALRRYIASKQARKSTVSIVATSALGDSSHSQFRLTIWKHISIDSAMVQCITNSFLSGVRLIATSKQGRIFITITFVPREVKKRIHRVLRSSLEKGMKFVLPEDLTSWAADIERLGEPLYVSGTMVLNESDGTSANLEQSFA